MADQAYPVTITRRALEIIDVLCAYYEHASFGAEFPSDAEFPTSEELKILQKSVVGALAELVSFDAQKALLDSPQQPELRRGFSSTHKLFAPNGH